MSAFRPLKFIAGQPQKVNCGKALGEFFAVRGLAPRGTYITLNSYLRGGVSGCLIRLCPARRAALSNKRKRAGPFRDSSAWAFW